MWPFTKDELSSENTDRVVDEVQMDILRLDGTCDVNRLNDPAPRTPGIEIQIAETIGDLNMLLRRAKLEHGLEFKIKFIPALNRINFAKRK